MPRTLVINGKFNPFSYDELVKPLRTATEQHQQVEAAYGELGAAADLWADIAMNEKDSEAAAMYSKYSDDLRKQADNLAMYGLNGNSRRELFNMKRRYASEIQPIENAYNARVEDIKLQRELSAKDPSLLWNSSASSASIDSYLHGNRPDYYSVSGDDMYKRAMTGAKAISSRYFSTQEGVAFNGAYFDLVQRQGINPAQALAILRNTGEFPEFNSLVESLKEGSNYGKLDDAGKSQIDNRILEGINAGLGYEEKHSLQDNWPLKQASQYAYSRALARDKAALAASASGLSGRNTLPMNTIELRTPGTKETKDTRRAGRVANNSILTAISASGNPSQRVDMRKALKQATFMDNGALRSKFGDSRFSMFDSKGNMLSRDKFIEQGADSKSRNNLGKIYDDFVKDVKKAGYNTDSITYDGLSGYLNETSASNNSRLTFAVELPIGTLGGGNDEVFNKLRSKTSNGLQIEEITSFDGDKVVTSGKPIDISKIDSKSVNFALTYDGLVVFDGTNYGLVRPENIGSLAGTSMENMQYYRELSAMAQKDYEMNNGGLSYEQFLRQAAPPGEQYSYYDLLSLIMEASMTNMIKALNYSFASTAYNPTGKGNLLDYSDIYGEEEEDED